MSRLLRSTVCIAALAAGLTPVLLPRMAGAEQIKLDVGLSHPFLLADKKQTTYLKVSMTGFEMKSAEQRAPINVAIVLDKSGSMTGDKIQKAKEAARMFIERLAREDIVSVVAYDSTVSVLVPATKASDRSAITRGISRLYPGGNTALFAGLSKGAAEVRKFIDRNQVNRIVLLSDGLANVGPSSPAELGELGASLVKEGIAVTTLGLGLDYNEDLMTQLAMRSDGNHAFVETVDELARFFKMEFGAVSAVAAQELVVKITCADGVRPIRVLGREADITGQTVVSPVHQLYSNQERYVLLEVEVPSTQAGRTRPVATVSVSYANMQTKTTDVLTSSVAVRFTKEQAKVDQDTDAGVMCSAIEQIATLNNARALALRDQGKVEEARETLRVNARFLGENAERFQSKVLKEFEGSNIKDAENLDPENWEKRRKQMRDDQIFRYLGPAF